jgi:two-component system NtrC family sensor kinase
MSQLLEEKVERLTRELSEVSDQLTATSEVLRIISNSPTDLQSALGTIAESAARLLDVADVEILRVEGDALRVVAKRSWHKADMPMAPSDVRFGRQSGHGLPRS